MYHTYICYTHTHTYEIMPLVLTKLLQELTKPQYQAQKTLMSYCPGEFKRISKQYRLLLSPLFPLRAEHKYCCRQHTFRIQDLEDLTWVWPGSLLPGANFHSTGNAASFQGEKPTNSGFCVLVVTSRYLVGLTVPIRHFDGLWCGHVSEVNPLLSNCICP